MSIIDKTYFIGEINLPGLQSADNAAALAVFITKYEKQYLQAALGYSLWKMFDAGIAADAPEPRWLALRDGAEYTNCRGFDEYWIGFKNSDRLSPIANYVYYWYSRDNVSFTSTAGEEKSKNENSSSVSAIAKQSRAYNEMSRLTDKLHEYLAASAGIYPEFDKAQTECFGRTNIFNL